MTLCGVCEMCVHARVYVNVWVRARACVVYANVCVRAYVRVYVYATGCLCVCFCVAVGMGIPLVGSST